jgi:hypothetical protein
MKKSFLFILLTGTTLLLFAQDDTAVEKKRFYGGLAFSYFTNQLEMTGYSSSNSIDGESFEWHDWPDDEIADFNTYVCTSQNWMVPSLLFGMKILDPPGSRWLLSGEASVGYMFFHHEEEDRNTGATLLKVKNDGRFNISGSLAFDLKYRLGKWYLAANPAVITGVAHSYEVEYNYLPEGEYETSYDLTTTIIYPKMNLLGGYSFHNLSIYAGGGVNFYYNRHHLEISKSTLYQTFGDEIKVDFRSKSNFNAVAGFDWLIADRFLWKAKAEAGAGWLAQTSLIILF